MGDGWRGFSNLEGMKKATWKLYIGSLKCALGSLGVESIFERHENHLDTWQAITGECLNLILNLNFKFKIGSNFCQSKNIINKCVCYIEIQVMNDIKLLPNFQHKIIFELSLG